MSRKISTVDGKISLALSVNTCYISARKGVIALWLDKLRKMKETSKLTTKEISLQSGIPEPTLEKLFAGVTKDPKLETMRQLVHFLGYTLDDLEDSSEKVEKSPSADKSTLRDEREKEIMRLVGTMSSEQKDFFLALLQTTVARNQGTLAVDPLLAGQAAQKSEHHDPAR